MKLMKKIIYILLLSVVFCCSENENAVNTYDLEANVVLKTTSISNLDENHTIEATIFTDSDVSVTEMTISKGSNNINPTISGNKATFNSSFFGTLKGQEKDGVDFSINSSLSNSKSFTNDFTIEITKALSLTQPLEAIVYKNSVEDTLVFKSSTESAIINKITLEWKKGKAGTYAPSTPLGVPLKVKGDMIIFKNFDNDTYNYNLKVKDTLYYRFTATSGKLKDILETSIPVISQTFKMVHIENLSSDLTKNKLNLSTQTFYTDANDDKGEIKFKSPTGFEKEGNTSIDFVKAGDLSAESVYYNTVDKLFAEKDLLIAKKIYDAGAKVKEVSDTSNGDLFIYKITRVKKTDGKPDKNITNYGMIKIVGVNITDNGTGLTKVAIEYGEAEIN